MMAICYVKVDTKYDQILQNSIQETSMSSKYDYVLNAFIIMLGSLKWQKTAQEWQIMLILNVKFDIKSSKNPVRNH